MERIARNQNCKWTLWKVERRGTGKIYHHARLQRIPHGAQKPFYNYSFPVQFFTFVLLRDIAPHAHTTTAIDFSSTSRFFVNYSRSLPASFPLFVSFFYVSLQSPRFVYAQFFSPPLFAVSTGRSRCSLRFFGLCSRPRGRLCDEFVSLIPRGEGALFCRDCMTKYKNKG